MSATPSNISRVRDGLMEMAHSVNLNSKICGVFPMKEGAFIRVRVASTDEAMDLTARIREQWPLLNVSKHTSALDEAIEVGVLVPNPCTAWWRSLDLAREGFLYSTLGLMARGALVSAVVAFLWHRFQALKI